eukprot:6386167-Pyramimonas_sp.AAC.2
MWHVEATLSTARRGRACSAGSAGACCAELFATAAIPPLAVSGNATHRVLRCPHWRRRGAGDC